MEYFTLSNGMKIPAIGYGCGSVKRISDSGIVWILYKALKEKVKKTIDPEFRENNRYWVLHDWKKEREVPKIIEGGLQDEVRLFDTARAYSYSERVLGNVIQKSHVAREDLFIITKLTNYAQRTHTVKESFEESLKELNLDYVDLYLMHWPQTETYLESWKIMEEICRSGKAKAIGVCNCHPHHLEEIMKIAEIPPVVNEIECHPYLQQKEVRKYCKEKGIQVIAHTPTGRIKFSELKANPEIDAICQKYSISIAQLIMRWHYQLGNIPIPNTTNKKHLKNNMDIWGFSLDDEEMASIEKLDCGKRMWPDPDHCDFSQW